MRMGLIVLITGVFCFLGCGTARGDDDVLTLNGSAIFHTQGELPVGSVLTVTLEDVSRGDAPAVTLGHVQVAVDGGHAPIPFSLVYPRSAVLPQGSYAARARVTNGDRLLFTTTQRQQVDALSPSPLELMLEPVPTTDVSLTDTYWKIIEVDHRPIAVTDNMREPHLVLRGQDGRLAGSGGVNRLIGSYTLNGDALAFSPVASTMMAGPPEAMQQEQALIEALGRVRGYRIAGDRLTLLGESGEPVLTAVAVALN